MIPGLGLCFTKELTTTLLNAYQSQTIQNINIMALEYNYRNQINCKIVVLCNFFVHQKAFSETTNIYKFVVSSFPFKNVSSKLGKLFYIDLHFIL